MKSLADIQRSFHGSGRADKVATAKELRDSFESLKSPWGSISLDAPAVTVTPASVGAYTKLNGTTSLNNAGYLTSMPANNRIMYNGNSPRHFHVAVSVSFNKTGGGTDIIALVLAKNGQVQSETEVTRSVSSGTNVGSTALHGDFMMENGDYVELWVTNEDSASTSVNLQRMYMFMVGMFM